MEILEFCTQIRRESILDPCAKRSANLTVGTTAAAEDSAANWPACARLQVSDLLKPKSAPHLAVPLAVST
jgi:hypothetical protein